MRVREDNRNMALLVSVTLVCAMLALIAAAFEPAASTVRIADNQTAVAEDAPVRVVGVPFVPNTNPREHQ